MKTLLIFIVLLGSLAALADDLFVKPRLLKIYQEPSRRSKILTVVPKGKVLQSMRKIQGMYIFVKYENITGWVVKHSITRDLPSKTERVQIFRTDDNIKDRAQKNASSINDIGGVRGATNLSLMTFGERPVKLVVPKDEKRFAKEYEQLETIMNNQVGMGEAGDFIK